MTFLHLLTHAPHHEHGKAMAQDLRSPELPGWKEQQVTIMSMQPGNMLGKTKVVEGIYSMEGDFCRLRLNLSIISRCQGDVPSHHCFHRTKVRLSPWRISTVHICTWMRHPCFACQWLSSKLLSISSLNIKLMLPLPEQISTKSLRFGFSGKQPVQTLHSRKLGN